VEYLAVDSGVVERRPHARVALASEPRVVPVPDDALGVERGGQFGEDGLGAPRATRRSLPRSR